jgi:monoamine oxidase
MVDVAVVGAGAAGIAAARTVLSAQRSVIVLEAMDRVGGRCFTDTSMPVPFDTGAQFFAQSQSLNTDMYAIANQFGVESFGAETVKRSFYDPDLPLIDADPAVFYASYAAINACLLEQGLEIANGGQDCSALQVLEKAGLADLPYRELVMQFLCTVVVGRPESEESALDLFNFAQFSPAPFLYPPRDSNYVPGGLGTYLATLAGGLPIVLSAPVSCIARDADGVTIHRAGGEPIRARAVVVTASTAAVHGIEFDPALPPEYTQAFHDLPMGLAYKAMLGFNGCPFDGRLGTKSGTMNNVIPLVDGATPAYSVNYFAEHYPDAGTHLVVTTEAAIAEQYEAMGPQAAARDILARLEDPFPGITGAWNGRVVASSWGMNPYTRGGMSSAKAGKAEARALLQTPVGGRLWFAGEALSARSHSLLNGAWATGIAAGAGAARASLRT